jgi:hypothetical protein
MSLKSYTEERGKEQQQKKTGNVIPAVNFEIF